VPSFSGLLIVVAVAFAVPFVLGLYPRLRLPSVVLEIVAGIVIGPSVLGLVELDDTISVISVIGLAFLLFLAGLEIDFSRLRGRVLRLTTLGFVLSFAIAIAVSLVLEVSGLIETPLLVAIILCATSLGVLIPVLKDTGQVDSTFGQLVIAGGTIADFGAVILLSVFFSGEGGVGATLLLIGSLVVLAGVVFLAVRRAETSRAIRSDLIRLQDTTAQIRIRGAVVLLVGFAAIADELGLEAILGAFIAGAILSLLDRDQEMTHPDFRRKLDAVGFGLFIPVFFVASGVNFDLDALASSASNLLMVPIFLAALLAARGLPALLYRGLITSREVAVTALMQATSLPFIVAATAIGEELGLLGAAEGAALIGAGLLSVLLFPLIALSLLGGRASAGAAPAGVAPTSSRSPRSSPGSRRPRATSPPEPPAE
jgi:Kef-type K+ transport system membrane component KefB